MKRIICLWGGPGTGKSTTCAGVYNMLKKEGVNAEMSREYVKDWVWEGRDIQPGDQTYIMAKQIRKDRILIQSGVDVIITDSPAALAVYYGNKYDTYEREYPACKAILKQHHEYCKANGYRADHIFLVREKQYNPAGRLQTGDEAKSIDGELLLLLKELNINFVTLNCNKDVENKIVARTLRCLEDN